MISQCRQEEKCLKEIIVRRNVQVNEPQNLNLHIYYKNHKLRHMFIKNNHHANAEDSRVAYQYTCSQEMCQPIQTYIGYTTTANKQIMTTQAQNGSIVNHSVQVHCISNRAAYMMKDIKIL